jgi:folate-binding protein YgfZ
MIDAISLAAYEAARHGAGLIDRSDRGRIVVSGADRATYLQGLLSNDIVSLKPGRGCYATYLTAQGRMIADLFVYELGDLILLTMSGDVTSTVLARLDQFIFSEDVQLGDVTETFGQLGIVGPDAARVASTVVTGFAVERLVELPEHGNTRAFVEDQPAMITRISDTGEPGFDLFVDRSQIERLKTQLQNAGATMIDAATADTVRIESGVPAFHRDMDEQTIPLEAGIEDRAISLTKGCYVGQEVIIRVLHRGHGRVARKLVGLTITGESQPSPGDLVRSGDREIGHVTSATISPALKRPIALAYVQRDFVQPGTQVTVGDGVAATVTALPFIPRHA